MHLHLPASRTKHIKRTGNRSKGETPSLELAPIARLDTGVKALLFEQKLTVGISASDTLASQKVKGTNQVTGQVTDNYRDARNLRIHLSYKFGDEKVRARRERKTGIEEEKSRSRSGKGSIY